MDDPKQPPPSRGSDPEGAGVTRCLGECARLVVTPDPVRVRLCGPCRLRRERDPSARPRVFDDPSGDP